MAVFLAVMSAVPSVLDQHTKTAQKGRLLLADPGNDGSSGGGQLVFLDLFRSAEEGVFKMMLVQLF